MNKLEGVLAMVPPGLSDLQLATLYCIVTVPLIILFSIPIYYFTERPFMNGPGSRFIERVLRGTYGHLQSKLGGWSRFTSAKTSPPAESTSHEQS